MTDGPEEVSQRVREKYYAFLCLGLAWVLFYAFGGARLLGIGGGWYFSVWVVTCLALAVGTFLFRCKACDQVITLQRRPFGRGEITLWQQFPGKRCSNCEALL